MYKLISVFCCFLIVGCMSTNDPKASLDKEALLLQAQNYSELVGLYKAELIKKDTSETRIKLARSYLMIKDADSALFTLQPLMAQKKVQPDVLLVNASAHYELGNFKLGLTEIKRALDLDAGNAEIQNLAGLLYAANGDYNHARTQFNHARTNFYNDITIKNNLAVLDIIEGHYLDAVQRLMPIYTNDQADAQVEANLMLALAKLGNFDYVRSMLGPEITEEEAFNHFAALRNSEAIVQHVAEPILSSKKQELQ